MTCCVLLLLGAPAVGKSTVARRLLNALSDTYDVTHVEYDVICEPSVGGECVSWRQARTTALCGWQQQAMMAATSRREQDRPLVLLIDDTMHLRSMRYQCYQAARRHRAGFAQMLLTADLAECVRRDAGRQRGRVGERVVRLVHERLEPPDPSRHHWERHSVTTTAASHDIVRVANDIISAALSSPTAPIIDRQTTTDHSRHVCSTNQRHRIDTALRRLVGEYAGGRADRAQAANKARRSVMWRVNNGQISLSTQDNVDCIDSLARDLFNSELAGF